MSEWIQDELPPELLAGFAVETTKEDDDIEPPEQGEGDAV